METLRHNDLIAHFRSEIEEVARVEGQMPSPEEMRHFMDELDGGIPEDAAGADAWFDSFSKLWWRRFAKLETEKARRAVRLHVRLRELYEELADGSDKDLATYAQLRDQARASAAKAAMALLKRPEHRDA